MTDLERKMQRKMVVRNAIIALWLVATIIGGACVRQRWRLMHRHRNYVASHAMAKNHRLGERDLAEPRIGGSGVRLYLPPRDKLTAKYLLHAVAKGDAVRVKDVADHPIVAAITCNACERPVFVPVSNGEADAINAGSLVDYVGDKQPALNKRVAAVAVVDKKPYAVVMMNDAEKAGAGDGAKIALRSAWSDPMQELTWTEVVKDLDVPARPAGIWTLALPYVPPGTKLKIESSGTWKYDANTPCGPDGDITRPNTGALSDKAPLGALIGKLGGSSAGLSDTTNVFAAGSFAIYDTGQNAGPLFFTINVPPTKFPPPGTDKIKVTISEAK
jgi:hypothetical protein